MYDEDEVSDSEGEDGKIMKVSENSKIIRKGKKEIDTTNMTEEQIVI